MFAHVVTCHSICKEQEFEEEPMCMKKIYVVSRYSIGKTRVGILRNEKNGKVKKKNK